MSARAAGPEVVDDAARGRRRLDVEPRLHALQTIPEAHAPPEHDRHDDEVQMVDEIHSGTVMP